MIPAALDGLVAATSKEAVEHVLGVLNERGGVKPGRMTEHVIMAALVADSENRVRLFAGFPEEVAAVVIYKDVPGGTRVLARIAHASAEWLQ